MCIRDRESTIEVSGQVQIYADSDLCFLNQYGEYTSRLEPSHFGINQSPDATIDWSLSKMNFRKYYPYNGYRGHHDPERIVLTKGSVVIINGVQPSTIKSTCAGVHLSESLGHIIVNPTELSNKTILDSAIDRRIKVEPDKNNDRPYLIDGGEEDNETLGLIGHLMDQKVKESKYEKLVEKFDKDHGTQFRSIQSSQWSSLYRQMSVRSDDADISNIFKNGGYLRSGQREAKWESGQVRALETFVSSISAPKKRQELLRRIAKEYCRIQKTAKQ